MGWIRNHPEPSNQGEPQPVRARYDQILKEMADASAQIEEAMSEIEID